MKRKSNFGKSRCLGGKKFSLRRVTRMLTLKQCEGSWGVFQGKNIGCKTMEIEECTNGLFTEKFNNYQYSQKTSNIQIGKEHFNIRVTAFHVRSQHGEYTVWGGWSFSGADDSVLNRGSTQDIICCPGFVILVKRRETLHWDEVWRLPQQKGGKTVMFLQRIVATLNPTLLLNDGGSRNSQYLLSE